MTHRIFNRPREGLERDSDGHRTGFKLYIKVRSRISYDGWRRLGTRLKINFSKSPYRWKYYTSTRAMGLVNGVDIEVMKTNKALGTWLITFAGLSENEIYGIYGFTAGKTKTHVKFTKCLALIEVQSVEKMSFRFTKASRLEHYWFRKEEAKKRRKMWGD